MKFAIVGTGGVGGYFGGKLAAAGEDVWFLARGQHLEAIRSNGFRVNSFEGNWIVPAETFTDDPSIIGKADVILFCVKSYDTESAALHIGPMLSENTIIISLQNGVDNEEKIQQMASHGSILGGVSYIYSTITAPGSITHTVGPTRIIFGTLSKNNTAIARKAAEIVGVMVKSGIDATLADDIRFEIWKKYVFIAAVGGMTALTRLTLGEILAVDESKEMLADAMRETEAIARAKKVALPENFIESIFHTLKQYDNNSRSSLYHDLIHGRRLEVEAFSGTIIRYGEALGIPTPVHRAMYASLLPYHLKQSK